MAHLFTAQGVGSSGGYSLKPRKPSITGVAKVCASGYRTFVIKRDRSLWWVGMTGGARSVPVKPNTKVFSRLVVGSK